MQKRYNRSKSSRKYIKKSKKSKKSKTIKKNRKIYLGGWNRREINDILLNKYPGYQEAKWDNVFFDIKGAFKDGIFKENDTYDLNDKYKATIKKNTIHGSYGGSNFGKLQFIVEDKLSPDNKPRVFWTQGEINY